MRDWIDAGDPQQLMAAGIGFAIVTAVLFQGDGVLTTLLNGGGGLLGLSLRAWAVGSPWVVAAVFIGIPMLIGMAIIDPDRPRELCGSRAGCTDEQASSSWSRRGAAWLDAASISRPPPGPPMRFSGRCGF